MQAFAPATAGHSFLRRSAARQQLPRRPRRAGPARHVALVPIASLPLPPPPHLPRRHVLHLLGGVCVSACHAGAAPATRAAAAGAAEPLPLEPYRDAAGAFALLRPTAWARDAIVSTAAFAHSSGIGAGPGVAFTYLPDPSENMSVLGRPCGGSGGEGGAGRSGCDSLRALGTPGAFGRRLVRGIEQSAPKPLRVASMLAARERLGHAHGVDVLYYEVEYAVSSPAWARRNICVAAARNGVLYTLNVQAPLVRWAELSGTLHAIADSFELL
jgi:hypothetical protein